MSNQTGWLASAGLHGYLPNYADVYETKADAIEGLLNIHTNELGQRPRVKGQLQRDGLAFISLPKWGNEVLSVRRVDLETGEVIS